MGLYLLLDTLPNSILALRNVRKSDFVFLTLENMTLEIDLPFPALSFISNTKCGLLNLPKILDLKVWKFQTHKYGILVDSNKTQKYSMWTFVR